MENGNYSGVAGLMQQGHFDTSNTYMLLDEDYYDHFLHTNAFDTTRLALLMKRQSNFIVINTIGLAAGFNYDVYLAIFAAFLCLVFLSSLNERRIDENANSIWQICHSVMPANMKELKQQSGCTRKILIISCSIVVFLSTVFYESNLLQMLLTPQPLKKVNIVDVANRISTFQSTLYTFDSTKPFIDKSDYTELKTALSINSPDTSLGTLDLASSIIQGNGIMLDELTIITQRLSQLKPDECSQYVVVELDDIPPIWITLMLRKERRDILETLNVIVLERMNFIRRLITQTDMSDECKAHIFPPPVSDMRFVPLSLYTLGGAFTLFLLMLLVSCIIFVCEFYAAKRFKSTIVIDQQRVLADRLDALIQHRFMQRINEDEFDHVFEQYVIFRDALVQNIEKTK
jgi:hypothetical protein